MKVLVTGATGFLGRRVSQLLARRGYKACALSRKYSDSPIPVVVGDIRSESACSEATRGVQVVIHAAAETRDPRLFHQVNVVGTRNVFRAAVENGVERVVHVSTVGVIGADPTEPCIFHEESPCRPRNAYERSKWEAECVVREGGADGPSVVILRPGNVFGDADPRRRLLRLARILRRQRFLYLGGRQAWCNYVFVGDVAEAILATVQDPRAADKTFHVTDGCTLGEFVDAYADDLGVARPTRELPKWAQAWARVGVHYAGKYEWLANSRLFAPAAWFTNRADFATSRLRDDLQFVYPYGWRGGVARTAEWYRSQGVL